MGPGAHYVSSGPPIDAQLEPSYPQIRTVNLRLQIYCCRALVQRRPDDLDTVFVRYLGQTSLIDRTWRRYGELGCLFADLGDEVRER